LGCCDCGKAVQYNGKCTTCNKKDKQKAYSYGSAISGPGPIFTDHRTTHCKRETHVKGNMINCGGYCECSDLPFKEWEKKALAGDCWQEPHEVTRNTLGGSFGQVVSQGYTHTG
jgi:hypothetical protein